MDYIINPLPIYPCVGKILPTAVGKKNHISKDEDIVILADFNGRARSFPFFYVMSLLKTNYLPPLITATALLTSMGSYQWETDFSHLGLNVFALLAWPRMLWYQGASRRTPASVGPQPRPPPPPPHAGRRRRIAASVGANCRLS